jgi:hypothetical protein
MITAAKRRLSWGYSLALIALLLTCIPAPAQGCSQCHEAVGQTPTRTQAAYRRGILVLVLAGACIFSSGIIAIRRFR